MRGVVSALFTTRVDPGREDEFLEWSTRVAAAQAAGADFEDTWGQLQELVRLVDSLRAGATLVATEERQRETYEDAERQGAGAWQNLKAAHPDQAAELDELLPNFRCRHASLLPL